jgi:predicted ferric reductase
MALIATGMYTLNRVLRWTRFLYFIPSNTATLTPLHASNATRVTLSRSMTHAAPGSHSFLYIPSIAALQSHPFTMINRDPIEFVVSAQAGFTKRLFEAACEKPGRRVRAGVEGAYGCVPDVSRYDTVVLMAGGSGATFAFALAIEWARRNDAESKGRCVFVWSVRTAGESKYFPTFKTAILLNVSLTKTNQPT